MNTFSNKTRDQYLAAENRPVETDSAILVSSSKYLNNPRLRDVIAQESLRRNGSDMAVTGLLPELMEAINEPHSYDEDLQAILAERQRLPEFAAFLDERFISDLGADNLRQCAPGTLGAEVHAYMAQTGMNINFLREGEIFRDDLHYYTRRSGQCHDIEHIVTGFGPNVWGEMALVFFKGVMDADYFSPAVASILNRQYLTAAGTYFIRTNLNYPHLLAGMMDAISLGVEMARRTQRQFLFIKWEDYWDTPLDEVRKELNISGCPEKGAWDWTNAAWRD